MAQRFPVPVPTHADLAHLFNDVRNSLHNHLVQTGQLHIPIPAALPVPGRQGAAGDGGHGDDAHDGNADVDPMSDWAIWMLFNRVQQRTNNLGALVAQNPCQCASRPPAAVPTPPAPTPPPAPAAPPVPPPLAVPSNLGTLQRLLPAIRARIWNSVIGPLFGTPPRLRINMRTVQSFGPDAQFPFLRTVDRHTDLWPQYTYTYDARDRPQLQSLRLLETSSQVRHEALAHLSSLNLWHWFTYNFLDTRPLYQGIIAAYLFLLDRLPDYLSHIHRLHLNLTRGGFDGDEQMLGNTPVIVLPAGMGPFSTYPRHSGPQLRVRSPSPPGETPANRNDNDGSEHLVDLLDLVRVRLPQLRELSLVFSGYPPDLQNWPDWEEDMPYPVTYLLGSSRPWLLRLVQLRRVTRLALRFYVFLKEYSLLECPFIVGAENLSTLWGAEMNRFSSFIRVLRAALLVNGQQLGADHLNITVQTADSWGPRWNAMIYVDDEWDPATGTHIHHHPFAEGWDQPQF